MSRSRTAPVARLSPGELAAALPDLCGFTPTESLVMLSLRAPRMRAGLTLRVDLPPVGVDLPSPDAEHLVELLRRDGADAVVAVVLTDEPDTAAGEHPRAAAVRTLAAAARHSGLEVLDTLLVRGGRWWSYQCSAGGCCNPEGEPVPTSGAALAVVAAARVATGRGLLGSRAELAATIAPAHPLGEAVARAVLDDVARELFGRGAPRRLPDPAALHAEWLDALAAGADPRHELDERVLARLAVSLGDIRVRDAVILEALRRPAPLLAILERACRASAPGYQAPVFTALAWVQYVEGGGALCRIALEHALADDPGYSAARMLQTALDGAVPPKLLRRSLRDARPLTLRALGGESRSA